MKFTDISIIDPILSIIVAIFIFTNALKNFKSVLDLFLEKIPNGIDTNEIKEHLLKLKNVIDVHHIHIWSIDGFNNYATMHIVVEKEDKNLKNKIREELREHDISHVTIEIETKDEVCSNSKCSINISSINEHHHH